MAKQKVNFNDVGIFPRTPKYTTGHDDIQLWYSCVNLQPQKYIRIPNPYLGQGKLAWKVHIHLGFFHFLDFLARPLFFHLSLAFTCRTINPFETFNNKIDHSILCHKIDKSAEKYVKKCIIYGSMRKFCN